MRRAAIRFAGLRLLLAIWLVGLVVPQAYAAIYRAPDGRLIERTIRGSVPARVVLCTDVEAYATGFHRFVDYFLADRDIVIVDGSDPSAMVPDGSIPVLFMESLDAPVPDCVGRIPMLAGLLDEFRANYEPQMDARIVVPGAKPGSLMRTISSMRFLPPAEGNGPPRAAVGLCAPADQCESLFNSLFFINPDTCCYFRQMAPAVPAQDEAIPTR